MASAERRANIIQELRGTFEKMVIIFLVPLGVSFAIYVIANGLGATAPTIIYGIPSVPSTACGGIPSGISYVWCSGTAPNITGPFLPAGFLNIGNSFLTILVIVVAMYVLYRGISDLPGGG